MNTNPKWGVWRRYVNRLGDLAGFNEHFDFSDFARNALGNGPH
jgi:hypothetical protein